MLTRSEVFIKAPVPATDWTFIGYIDELPPDGTLVDFKTSNDPTAYIEGQATSHQLSLLVGGLRAMTGEEVRRVAYRIIQRPSIKWKVKQTWEEYVDECHDWFAKPSTSSRIVNHDVPVDWQRVEESFEWLARICERIDWLTGGRPIKNESACRGRGYTCPFVMLCETSHNPTLQERVREQWFEARERREHPEELKGPVISYSGAKTFADCETRYVYQYWNEIQKVRNWEDDGEALSIGKLFHSLRELTAGHAGDYVKAEVCIVEDTPRGGTEEEARKIDEMLAKAIAMNRAALQVWPVEVLT